MKRNIQFYYWRWMAKNFAITTFIYTHTYIHYTLLTHYIQWVNHGRELTYFLMEKSGFHFSNIYEVLWTCDCEQHRTTIFLVLQFYKYTQSTFLSVYYTICMYTQILYAFVHPKKFSFNKWYIFLLCIRP